MSKESDQTTRASVDSEIIAHQKVRAHEREMHTETPITWEDLRAIILVAVLVGIVAVLSWMLLSLIWGDPYEVVQPQFISQPTSVNVLFQYPKSQSDLDSEFTNCNIDQNNNPYPDWVTVSSNNTQGCEIKVGGQTITLN